MTDRNLKWVRLFLETAAIKFAKPSFFNCKDGRVEKKFIFKKRKYFSAKNAIGIVQWSQLASRGSLKAVSLHALPCDVREFSWSNLSTCCNSPHPQVRHIRRYYTKDNVLLCRANSTRCMQQRNTWMCLLFIYYVMLMACTVHTDCI